MKILTLITFLVTTSLSYGQSDFSSLLENVQSISTPYKFPNEDDGEIIKKKKVLTERDSIYLVSKLISREPTLVNQLTDSPFGDMDCCLNVEDLIEISIIGFIKVDSNNYLLHIALVPSTEILVSMNVGGEINDWIFVANGIVGNRNGSLVRNFKIDKDNRITVSESSWGINNINYSLEVEYKVFRFSENKDSGNDEYEHNDYDNREDNKIEFFDLNEGKFELTKLCLDI